MIDWSETLNNALSLLAYDPKSPMLFSSGLFWAIFLVFMPIYASLKGSRPKMVLFMIFFSLYFYYKSSGFYLFLLVATSFIDWWIALKIAKSESTTVKKWLVALSVTLSLSVLAYFKYANFFLMNWDAIIGANFQPLDIILPIGISYYTFRSISYVVDVYRGKTAPVKYWLEYLFFLSFFPALVAGPIVRAGDFMPQLRKEPKISANEVYGGLWLIIIGVIKKAIIADYICQYNNLVFDTPTGYNGFETLMGVLGYTAQIYCDFSGYSDMAIGLALIMGFKLLPNFDFPYRSTSLTEFWRRWHISLSTWLRDYLYIPLGGNRKGTLRTYLNNFLTMLLGGLWHGAAWKFVFWGAMHGAGLAVNKAFRPYTSRFDGKKWFTALSWLLTMITVAFLWIFFRADSWDASWAVVGNILTNFSIDYLPPFVKVRYMWVIMMIIIIVTHSLPRSFYDRLADKFIDSSWLLKLVIFIIVVQTVVTFAGEDVPPFIYFQF